MTVIVADTGAVLGLLDAGDRHHAVLRKVYSRDPGAWVLPWAILPEVDYLVSTHVGSRAQEAFLDDLASGALAIEWGTDDDVVRAREICRRHRKLRLGLVDAVVMTVAERLEAEAIATLDLRHFGAVQLDPQPRLLPRDLSRRE